MKLKKPLKVILLGQLLLFLMMSSGCAKTYVTLQVPDYLKTPCDYPSPREINTNSDVVELLVDYYNALNLCSEKQRLIVKYIEDVQ